jgi:hypothetical protein
MTWFCAIEVIGELCQRSIGLWWDILVIAVFSLVIYYWARQSGFSPERPRNISM